MSKTPNVTKKNKPHKYKGLADFALPPPPTSNQKHLKDMLSDAAAIHPYVLQFNQHKQQQIALKNAEQNGLIPKTYNKNKFIENANLKFRRFIRLYDYIITGVSHIHPQIQEDPSPPVFVLNLCHGTIPLKKVNVSAENPHSNHIIEYISPVIQNRIVKAPMGTCPLSNAKCHHDLLNKLLTIDSSRSADVYHEAVKRIIIDPLLLENEDQTQKEDTDDSSDKFTGQLPICGRCNDCYKDIVTNIGIPTVNKIFTNFTSDGDDGIYILNDTEFYLQYNLPKDFGTRVREIKHEKTCVLMAEGYYTFIKNVEENPEGNVVITIPEYTYFNIRSPYIFDIPVSFQVLPIYANQRFNCSVYSSAPITLEVNYGTMVHLPENSQFIYYGEIIYFKNNGIPNNICSEILFSDQKFKIYPYPIGFFDEDSRKIRYQKGTDLLSCPYFMEYVKIIHKPSETITGAKIDEIIKPAKSLLYPYFHKLVVSTSASIIAYYFSNCSTYYSYDFSCQAYELIDDNGDIVSNIHFEATPENILNLNGYARGIHKRINKQKLSKRTTIRKMNKTRQLKNKLKRKIKQ